MSCVHRTSNNGKATSKNHGVSRVARSMKFPGKVSAFMDQEPRKVAAFVGSVMEDEYHVLFECPTYHHIRLKYEEALFSNFGGVSRAAQSMRPSGKVSAFMNQNPRKVAAFVSECLDYRRFEASDLLPYATRETLEELGLVGYQIDTFSSDYDDYIDESGMVYDAHGA